MKFDVVAYFASGKSFFIHTVQFKVLVSKRYYLWSSTNVTVCHVWRGLNCAALKAHTLISGADVTTYKIIVLLFVYYKFKSLSSLPLQVKSSLK